MTRVNRRNGQEGPKESEIRGIVCPDCHWDEFDYEAEKLREFPEGAFYKKCKACGKIWDIISSTEISCYEKCRDMYRNTKIKLEKEKNNERQN